MPFYIFAWAAAFLFGLEVIIGKLTSKHAIPNPWYFNFLWELFVLLCTIPIALYFHAGLPKDWTSIIILSFVNAISGIFYIFALSMLDVSAFSPLFNFRTVFSVLLGVMFLGEVLTTQQYLLVGVIVTAGLFVSLDEKLTMRSFFQKGVLFAMLEMVTLAFYGMFTKQAIQMNGYWSTNLWMDIVTQIMLLVTIPLFFKNIRRTTSLQIQGALYMALAGGLGVLASTRAYATNISISSAIVSLPFSMIMAMMLSFIAPKFLEKHTMKVYAIRFTAAAVMILAALKLSS